MSKKRSYSKTLDGQDDGIFDTLEVGGKSEQFGDVDIGDVTTPADLHVFGNLQVDGIFIVPVIGSAYFSATDTTLQYRTATSATLDLYTPGSATPTFNFKNSALVTTASTVNLGHLQNTQLTQTVGAAQFGTVGARLSSFEAFSTDPMILAGLVDTTVSAGAILSLSAVGAATLTGGGLVSITSSGLVSGITISTLIGTGLGNITVSSRADYSQTSTGTSTINSTGLLTLKAPTDEVVITADPAVGKGIHLDVGEGVVKGLILTGDGLTVDTKNGIALATTEAGGFLTGNIEITATLGDITIDTAKPAGVLTLQAPVAKLLGGTNQIGTVLTPGALTLHGGTTTITTTTLLTMTAFTSTLGLGILTVTAGTTIFNCGDINLNGGVITITGVGVTTLTSAGAVAVYSPTVTSIGGLLAGAVTINSFGILEMNGVGAVDIKAGLLMNLYSTVELLITCGIPIVGSSTLSCSLASGFVMFPGNFTTFKVTGAGMDVTQLTVTGTATHTAPVNIVVGATLPIPFTVDYTNTASNSILMAVTSSALSDGFFTETIFGRDTATTNDSVYSRFNYTSTGSPLNNMEFRMAGQTATIRYSNTSVELLRNTNVTGNLTVTGTYPSTSAADWASPGTIGSTAPNTGAFTILSASSTSPTGVTTFSALQPSLNNADATRILVGTTATLDNAAALTFNYTALNNAANNVGLGVFGRPQLLVDTLGNTTVSGNLTVTGTYPSVSAADWASPGTIGSTAKNTGAFTTLTNTDIINISNPTVTSTSNL